MDIQKYIDIASAIVSAGIPLVGTLKGVFDLIKPDHGLTDAEINQIEADGIADSERRKAERDAMGKSDSEG